MIYLLHGDDFQVRRALGDVKERARAADPVMFESNCLTLDGRGLTPDELLAQATVVPFMAAGRVLIVEGLLKAAGESKDGRRKKTDDDPIEPWRRAAAMLGDPASMPETTTLVFVEGALAKTNRAFPVFAPIARTIDHPPLQIGDLPGWITRAAKEKDVALSGRAAHALAQLIGPDLWTLDRELDKLAAYAGGEPVDETTVSAVVSAAEEARLWDLTDGIVDGDARKALAAMRVVLGASPAPVLVFMIARQFRQLAIVKDMRGRRLPDADLMRALDTKSSGRLRALTSLAGRYSWPSLRAAYRRILEADLAVKRGEQDDETALELLVAELCAMAPSRGAAPGARR